ncbi:MAG: amino acid ABC transporter permease [Alphaproteobacteria bacterium]|nr:amino acid ABC transporter permease [Alphaproteobacteria bacterium]
MTTAVETSQKAEIPPPASTVGWVGWLRENLFSSWQSTVLTLLAIWIIYLVIPPFIQWAFIDAIWTGNEAQDCKLPDGSRKDGACWIYIKAWIGGYMYGLYPYDLRWRIDLAAIAAVLMFAPLSIKNLPYKNVYGVAVVLLYPIVAYFMFYGFVDFPPGAPGSATHPWRTVQTDKWGGLALTLLIASVGIIAALPLGILLALGRRSSMPIVSTFSVVFIELWRGVPLITVLFMSSVMLPLFLPEGVNFDKLLRALIGVTMFSAAYMAEVVRGGLAAIPKGQYEGAMALGLSYPKMMTFIILPQALRYAIPNIVSNFIGLFKDTTLVAIIGMFDLLGAIQLGNADPKWLGFSIEGYAFAALLYFVFCFSMSRYSQHLERKLHTGHKKR